ncbi:MAG: glycine cleavage system protein GcvH [Bacteriovoracaceae bacterium]|nr:glycine cleavage system protein GcvH [Bacteriovoracaceae bacterium]
MSNIPSNLKYTIEHEWVDTTNPNVMVVGITDFAQSSLGDIVFVELPSVGAKLEKDKPFGVVESIKSVSDLYAPISGEVLEKNTQVEGSPESINQNSYSHWLIKIKPSNPQELTSLLSSEEYKGKIS